MKRLYTVTVQTDMMVLAESEREAETVALRHASREEWDAEVWHHVEIPHGWDVSCIPHGDGDPAAPDRTIGEWIDLTAPSEGKDHG